MLLEEYIDAWLGADRRAAGRGGRSGHQDDSEPPLALT
jgi:hypothetical protein